ncbi:MAG TPA: RNA polymerase sigma-70 factor [Chitinophagaceae bacterium]|jgi:RNA polymerase sigma-70 factor (ECF subfamily)|nr:RNA polymerase sigma-70 factor [Chitinophagaceae bacterium]
MPFYTPGLSGEETFRKLYDAYRNRLYGYVLAIVHSSDAAEDITQEMFIKLWVNRDMLDSVTSMEHYLFVMARNRTLNYLRKAANDARLLAELQRRMIPMVNNVEEHIVRDEYQQLVDEALKQLSPQRSLVFRLSRYQNLKLEEIASQLSLSRNTVKNHLVEALRFIRSYLTKHGVTLLLLAFFLLGCL